MEYPHRRYILYLLSKRMNGMEINADCVVKDLLPPEPRDRQKLLEELGPIPTFWKARVTRENIRFRRWLRNKKLLSLWKRDVTTEKVFSFLHRKSVRHDFEAIILAHGNVEQARSELIIKYPEALVPTVKVLTRFQEIFWNVGEMHSQSIFLYLEDMQDREAHLPALQGDLVTVYGQLGLQQRVKADVFLQNVVDAAHQQVLMLRKNPDVSGQMKAGTASLIKMGLDAVKQQRDQYQIGEGDTGVRQEAADFMARVIQDRDIPSIDDVTRDVIDAEYAEAGEANVHQLPIRR